MPTCRYTAGANEHRGIVQISNLIRNAPTYDYGSHPHFAKRHINLSYSALSTHHGKLRFHRTTIIERLKLWPHCFKKTLVCIASQDSGSWTLANI